MTPRHACEAEIWPLECLARSEVVGLDELHARTRRRQVLRVALPDQCALPPYHASRSTRSQALQAAAEKGVGRTIQEACRHLEASQPRIPSKPARGRLFPARPTFKTKTRHMTEDTVAACIRHDRKGFIIHFD